MLEKIRVLSRNTDSLTNSPERLLKIAGELIFDGVVDIVSGQIVVLLENGRELRERAGAKHSVEH